jgi:hypothetical protein
VAGGRYADILAAWRARYRPEQLRVWRAEDLYADPTRVVTEVLEYLGVDASLAPPVRNDGGVWASASPATTRAGASAPMAIQPERMRLLIEAFDLLQPFLTIRFMTTFPSQRWGWCPTAATN